MERKALRYAHAEGHTDVCYSEDGKHIITCGHDADVRIWDDMDDELPHDFIVGESAVAVCYKDKRLYVATNNHTVQAYTFPDFKKDGIVTRFTAPVTQIKTTQKIEALGCSCENTEAKICSPEGGTPLLVMTEHKGPVLSISLCPLMKYVSTASGDGYLRIWDIDTQKIVKEINCVPKINSFFAAKVLCRMDFEPTQGKYLAYPNNKEIILLECETWSQRMTFSHSSIKCAISQCLFSPCGEFLCGSSVAGQIAVWEVQSGNCIGVIEHPTSHNVTSLAWNPKGNGVLAFCDNIGQLGFIVNCYGKDSSTFEKNTPEDIEVIERVEDNDDVDVNLINEYESDDDNAISLEKLKNETLGLNMKEESRPPSGRSSPPAPRTLPPQPPFQPTATPTHLEHRYMCWNDVGIVRCHTSENGESTIVVEFHDTNVHHGINLNNYLNHTMASLSTTVLALACEVPSKVVGISLVGSSKEWSVSLPDTEEALCLAAADGVVACATTARLLRLFTPMGTQRQVISLPGPVVALAAYNSVVLAVYHSTDPGISDQHLAMDIIAMNGCQIRSKTVRVPLSPSSKLAWVGTSEVGAACTADDAGLVRRYDLASGLWVPICDTNAHSRGASDNWFIVSMNEQTQKVRAILCRGTSFPPTTPKPIITELPMQIPLCELDSEKGQCEEELLRCAISGSESKTIHETAIKLFALACRSEIEQRALELMELLNDERLLGVAAKYAARVGRMHLADRLSTLHAARHATESPDTHQTNDSSFNQLDDASEATDLNNSMVIPQKHLNKLEPVNTIRPATIRCSPFGIRNPFKKKQEMSKSATNPLSLTERTLVEVHDQPEEQTENNDILKPNSGESFVDWFSRNKTTLEEQHLDLTPSELTRHCIKMFKSLQAKNNAEKSNVSENGNKRKLDDGTSDSPITSAPKQSKLSAFAFKK